MHHAGRGEVYQGVHRLERALVTGVWIGNFSVLPRAAPIEEQGAIGARTFRSSLLQNLEIAAIGAQDEVEALEIGSDKLAGALGGNIDTVSTRGCHGAGIG